MTWVWTSYLLAVTRERNFEQIESHWAPQAAKEILSGSELLGRVAGSPGELPGKPGMKASGAQFERSAAGVGKFRFHGVKEGDS